MPIVRTAVDAADVSNKTQTFAFEHAQVYYAILLCTKELAIIGADIQEVVGTGIALQRLNLKQSVLLFGETLSPS